MMWDLPNPYKREDLREAFEKGRKLAKAVARQKEQMTNAEQSAFARAFNHHSYAQSLETQKSHADFAKRNEEWDKLVEALVA